MAKLQGYRFMIGKCISHYRILEKVDGGGMGVVFKAEDVKLGRPAALKFLPAALSDDEEAKERFIHEAQTASALDHPNICTIYEIGETDEDQLFIAMAYYEGETLHKKISRGALSVAEAVGYVAQIAAGLGKSHQSDVIHRDVKPANVLVTRDGQVKILDFGLAKILGDGITHPGLAQGTPAYMAPERIRNEKANPRTDLWSLGVVLYEALTGRRPFHGDSVAAIIQSVHGDEPENLCALNPEVPAALASIVGKLLSKKPEARYRSCEELLRDLEELGESVPELEGTAAFTGPLRTLGVGTGSWRAMSPAWNLRRWLPALALMLLGAAVLTLFLVLRRAPSVAPLAPDPTTLAILSFDNPSKDPELDWLRTGIPRRLADDLARSPQLRVLDIEHVERLLKELGETPELASSRERARQIARRGDADQVVVGSIFRSGDTLNILIQLQEAASGRLITEKNVNVDGDDDWLPHVDAFSVDLRRKLELPHRPASDPDLEPANVTTSSLEAWRAYSQGMRLHLEYQESEAAELFERAVELDPEFAMAWAKLAAVALNLGRPEGRQYAARALENAERLQERERYYVESIYWGLELRSWSKAIDSARKAVEVDPEHFAARQNLAILYGSLERYDEAVEQGEELWRHQVPYRGSYAALAESYAALGELELAEDTLLEVVRRYPRGFAGRCALGRLYQRAGRLEEAELSFTEAEKLQPATPINFHGLCTTYLLQERWRDALELSAARERFSEPSLRLGAARCRMLEALYRGRSAEALGIADDLAVRIPPPMGSILLLDAARIRLHRGEAELALDQAERALEQSRGGFAEGRALFYTALALTRLERYRDAAALGDQLRALAEEIPGKPERRRYRHLVGEIALAEGRVAVAVRELEAAAETLPAYGVRSNTHEPDHVPLWASLAEAYRAAGDDANAIATWLRILESMEERVVYPIHYVRSLYLIGQAYRARGDDAVADGYFDHFAELWKDGDLEREWVEASL